MWENAFDKVIDAAILVLSEELREIVREKRRKCGHKCRNCIALRESLGASNCLFRELSSYTSKNFTTSSLLHLDTIFSETAMQNKHAKKVRGTRAMTLAAE